MGSLDAIEFNGVLRSAVSVHLGVGDVVCSSSEGDFYGKVLGHEGGGGDRSCDISACMHSWIASVD